MVTSAAEAYELTFRCQRRSEIQAPLTRSFDRPVELMPFLLACAG